MTKKQKKWLVRIIISLFLFIIVFTIDNIINLESIINIKHSFIFPLSIYLIIYIIIGHDILIKSFKNILKGNVFDENFLMSIATIGAFAILEFAEGVAVILLYQIGEFFQSYAVGSSRKSIAALMDIRPESANLYQNGKFIEVDPEDVKVNDIILIKPGERVPLDGIIIKGSTSVDTKSLTGESKPIDLNINDNIISGSINLNGVIEVKVIKQFYDSTVSKILDLVENAQTKKSKSENFITKFAKYYTPIVVILALILAIIPSVITGNWSIWIYRALNFLVVSCPCAIVISVPLSFFCGLGAASKNGILVKGSNYLEQMADSNVFVLDKTGTLTKGNFKVSNIITKYDQNEILELAAICEKNSNHPIALSIIDEYNSKFSNSIDKSYNITDLPGLGIMAMDSNNNTILIGNEKLLENNNILFERLNYCGTIVYIAKNNAYLGAILIEDEIKKEAFEFINYLNKEKIKSVMLTGDNNNVAKHVANSLKISEYKSSLLPLNKVEEIEKILSKKDVVCYIGDGINDAPVLTRCDIGISMGQLGSDAAIEASDIVLMNDNLNDVITCRKIAKKTLYIVKQNIIFALTIKILVLILSALGVTNMWIAVFADVGVAMIAILNAMRASKIK